tara:strand:+ start:669 stop:833 length:165 start_codon:yes stop_codon:yes gene_type:complete
MNINIFIIFVLIKLRNSNDKTRNANLMLKLMELAESKRLKKKEIPIKALKTANK